MLLLVVKLSSGLSSIFAPCFFYKISKGRNVTSFPKRLFPTNKMSETGTILVTLKLSVRILCLVFRKPIAIHHCPILVALGLCVVSCWVINET